MGKKLEPELPVPEFKPLHPGRKANLLWKHRSMLLDRIQLPLPFEIICELEVKAGADPDNPLTLLKLERGGPRFDDFYTDRTLRHLSPNTIHVPLSKVARSQTVADMRSPYEAPSKVNIAEYLEEPAEKKAELIRFKTKYDFRQKRRIYRKLLNEIPCIDIVTRDTLWKNGMRFKLSKSTWAVKGVTQLLTDVPSEEVINATLKKNKKKNKDYS